MSAPPLTPRFELPLLTADEATALASGRRDPAWHAQFPQSADRAAAALLDAATGAAGAVSERGPRWIRRRVDGAVVGTAGLIGAADGEAELIVSVVPEAEGRGVEAEVVAALAPLADASGAWIAIPPSRPDLLKAVAASGFVGLRGSDDDDRLVMARLPR